MRYQFANEEWTNNQVINNEQKVNKESKHFWFISKWKIKQMHKEQTNNE